MIQGHWIRKVVGMLYYCGMKYLILFPEQSSLKWEAAYIQKSEDDEVFESERMPQVSDTHVAWGGASYDIFCDPVISMESVSSTPCTGQSPAMFSVLDISRASMLGTEMESEAELPLSPTWMRQSISEVRMLPSFYQVITNIAMSAKAYSPQISTEEF